MALAAVFPTPAFDRAEPDQRVVIHGLEWWRCQAMLAIRGDHAGVRLLRSLVFTGIATDIGIETSAPDAGARGFYPVVVRDGASSMDREARERSLESLERVAIVADMKEILAAVG
jgi:hypothetical protein